MILLVPGWPPMTERDSVDRLGPYLGHLLKPGDPCNRACLTSLLPLAVLPFAAGRDKAGLLRSLLVALKEHPGQKLFLCAPLTFDCFKLTRAAFGRWLPSLRAYGTPGFVAMPGVKPGEVPWDDFGALVLYGSQHWLHSMEVYLLAREAKARGKWVHRSCVTSFASVMQAQNIGSDSVSLASHLANRTDTVHAYLDFVKQLGREADPQDPPLDPGYRRPPTRPLS
jgi:hypothetical protein